MCSEGHTADRILLGLALQNPATLLQQAVSRLWPSALRTLSYTNTSTRANRGLSSHIVSCSFFYKPRSQYLATFDLIRFDFQVQRRLIRPLFFFRSFHIRCQHHNSSQNYTLLSTGGWLYRGIRDSTTARNRPLHHYTTLRVSSMWGFRWLQCILRGYHAAKRTVHSPSDNLVGFTRKSKRYNFMF